MCPRKNIKNLIAILLLAGCFGCGPDFWGTPDEELTPQPLVLVPDAPSKELLPDSLINSVTDKNLQQRLRELKKDKSKINDKGSNGCTALQDAIGYGNLEAVQTVIDAGADVNQQGVSGNTATHMAIQAKNVEVAKLLLKQPGIQVNVRNKENLTLLGQLHKYGGTALYNSLRPLLVEHGASL